MSSEESNVVIQFIKDVQPRTIKSKQKKHITAFARWYFAKKPQLQDRDLMMLLLGDGDRKGLLESCGNSNIKKIGDIKKSSILALELVVMLLDATINIHSEKFLDFLPRVPLKMIQSMKLDRHILNEASEPENAFKLLFMLHEQRPDTKISAYLDGNSDALKAYEDWYTDHMEELADEDADEDEGPRTWAQVKLEDLDREEAAGMEVDLDTLVGDGGVGGGGDDLDGIDLVDPLGLTKLKPGRMGVGPRDSNDREKKKGVSSSKRMKLFWKKLLKQKEVAKKKLNDKDAPQAKMPKSISEEEEDDDDEDAGFDDDGPGGVHLMDTILLSQKGSIYTSASDFNPILFLNTVHQQTSLTKLEAGLEYLSKSLKDREVAMKQLVEQYFGNYVYCKDTIDHLHQLIQSEVASSGKAAGGRTLKLQKDIDSVRQECESLYAPLLQRKSETDDIRAALEILGRFKFLFSLPKKLKEKRGGWEQVIRDYQKAKQLVVLKATNTTTTSTGTNSSNSNATNTSAATGGSANATNATTSATTNNATANASQQSKGLVASSPSNAGTSTSTGPSSAIIPTPANSVSLATMMTASGSATAHAAQLSGTLGIPESILLELVSLVRGLRRELFTLLDQPSTPWSEQEKVINYLLALDCEQDPAWYYLTKQAEAIRASMEKAMEELLTRIEQGLIGSNILKNFVAGPNVTTTTSAANINAPFALTACRPQGPNQPPPAALRLLNGSIPLSTLVLSTPETAVSLSRFIRKLCNVFSKSLPDFIALANQIEQGKYGGWIPPNGVETQATMMTQTTTTGTTNNAANTQASGSGHRTSVFESNSAPALALASPAATNNPLTVSPALGAASSPSAAGVASLAAANTSSAASVGQLISCINTQFVTYVRLVLFPSTSKVAASKPTVGPPTATTSLASPSTSTPLTSPTPGSVAAGGLVASTEDRPFFSFPPNMFTHMHDILTCVEGIRSLPGLPQEYTHDLKMMSEQLSSIYIEYHVKELLLGVSALPKIETWELDPIRVTPPQPDVSIQQQQADELEALFTVGGGDDVFGSAYSGGGVVGSAGGFGGAEPSAPLGHGHAGTTATNSPFQVTQAPLQFYYLVADTLEAFSAIPVIQTKWMVERMAGAMFEACKVFADGVHALASQLRAAQDASLAAVAAGVAGGPSILGPSFNSASITSPVMQWTKPNEFDRRILLLWSNTVYTLDVFLSPLLDQLLVLLPASVTPILETKFQDDITALYDLLELQILLPTYVRSKVSTIAAVIKKGYFKSGMNWKAKVQPQTAGFDRRASNATASGSSHTRSTLQSRSCILELLLNFVLIHDELYTVRKDDLDRIMEMIVDQVSLILLQTAIDLETVCDFNGANQFLLELDLVESTLDYYLTDASSTALSDAKHLLEDRLDVEAENVAIGKVKPSQVIEQATKERTQHMAQWKHTTASMWNCFTSIKLKRKNQNSNNNNEQKANK